MKKLIVYIYNLEYIGKKFKRFSDVDFLINDLNYFRSTKPTVLILFFYFKRLKDIQAIEAELHDRVNNFYSLKH